VRRQRRQLAGRTPERHQRGKVLPSGERRIEAGSVHEARDPVGHGERPPDRRTQDVEPPAIRDGEAQHQPEKSRLAGTVRPDHPVNLSGLHIEIYLVERDHVPGPHIAGYRPDVEC